MITVTDEQVKWLMERHGVPECLKTEFEALMSRELNESNYLDGAFYHYRQPLSVMAELKGCKLTPKSYEVEGKKEDLYQEERKRELDGTLGQKIPKKRTAKPKPAADQSENDAQQTPEESKGDDDVQSGSSKVFKMPGLREISRQ